MLFGAGGLLSACYLWLGGQPLVLALSFCWLRVEMGMLELLLSLNFLIPAAFCRAGTRVQVIGSASSCCRVVFFFGVGFPLLLKADMFIGCYVC